MAQPDVGTPGLGHLPLKASQLQVYTQTCSDLLQSILQTAAKSYHVISSSLLSTGFLLPLGWGSKPFKWPIDPDCLPFTPLTPSTVFSQPCVIGTSAALQVLKLTSTLLTHLLRLFYASPTVLTPHLFPFCINRCSLLSLQAVWEGMS